MVMQAIGLITALKNALPRLVTNIKDMCRKGMKSSGGFFWLPSGVWCSGFMVIIKRQGDESQFFDPVASGHLSNVECEAKSGLSMCSGELP
jgi:hypothetical protein